MACYTLSECVLEHLDDGRQYTSVLLNAFIQENDFKIAIDDNNKIKEIYVSIAENIADPGIKYGILSWLYLMTTFKPQKWEYLDIGDSGDDIFLEVCSKTIDKKMIVSSENKCKWKDGISIDRLYSHKGTSIKILNKDEAISELQSKTNVNIVNTNINTNTNSK